MSDQDSDNVPQIDNETLNVKDSQKGTEGGPPGWMALVIVGGIFLLVGSVVLIASLVAS